MEWLSQNWFWVLIGAAFIAVHVFGHGGHGGHGGNSGGTRGDSDGRNDLDGPPAHRH